MGGDLGGDTAIVQRPTLKADVEVANSHILAHGLLHRSSEVERGKREWRKRE